MQERSSCNVQDIRSKTVFRSCYEVVHAAAASNAPMQVITFRMPRIYPSSTSADSLEASETRLLQRIELSV